ncbi:MAG: OsmC family peroxiredoxin [Anaerolineae bacterium]|nr:OsmC family peroxiredoxin [Anaerolineae bacterium]
MSTIIQVEVTQVGPTTSEGRVRGHKVLVDRPTAKGGADQGAMGGELLLVALGGCFMSTLLAAIREREAAVADVHMTIDGTLASAPSRFTAVQMHITAHYEDAELMQKLVTIAERGCIVANTLKDAVELSISVGRP